MTIRWKITPYPVARKIEWDAARRFVAGAGGKRVRQARNQTGSDFPVDPGTPEDWLRRMKEMSVTDVARNFSAVLDEVGLSGEEVVLVRNRRRLARLVPESSGSNALEVFGDLYRTLDDATATELARHVAKRRATEKRGSKGALSGLRNPWAG